MKTIACENIRFSSLFAARDVSRETSPATKSEKKRMFSQAMKTKAVCPFVLVDCVGAQ